MKSVKDCIKEYVKSNGITYATFAEKLGVSRSSLYEKMDDRSPWMIDEAVAMSELFGCTVDELAKLILKK